VRLLVIIGSWQAILGASAIRSACGGALAVKYVICIRRDNESDMSEACRNFFLSRGIELILMSYRDYQSGNLSNKIRKLIGCCDEVYFPLTATFARLKYWPVEIKDKISFYEDGLHSLAVLENLQARDKIDKQRGLNVKAKDLIKVAYRNLRNRNRSHHMVKIPSDFRAYWGLLKITELPYNFHFIDPMLLAEEISLFGQLNSKAEDNETILPGTVILGSNFAMHGMLSADVEYRPVCEFIESFSSDSALYWKPHPRASYLYSDYLLRKYPQVKPWPAHGSAMPFECHIGCQPDLKVVSLMSTSVAYAKLIYGRDVALLGDLSESLKEAGTAALPSYLYLKSLVDGNM